jgi:hypothetical protein
MRQGHDLRYVSRVFEDDYVMGIETYGFMVFSSMKPLTKPQKEKLARNKAGLRALTKKSVSLSPGFVQIPLTNIHYRSLSWVRAIVYAC